MIFLKTYKYRAYPTKAQTSNIENQFSMCRCLYNWALADRIWLYENHGVSIDCYSQINELPILKAERPWFKGVHSQVLQDVLKRLDLGFKSFFRRVKEGAGAAGFPKVKKFKQYNSITYPQYSEAPISNTIKVPKIGNLKIVFHRNLPENAKVKTLSVTKEAGKWFVCFSFEHEFEVEHKQSSTFVPLGIDLGLDAFLYDSNGKHVKAPRFFRKSQDKLAKLQVKFSKAEKKSKRYGRLLVAIQKCHYKIKCQRQDFHHKTANDLLSKIDVLVVEKLTVKNMSRKPKPKKDPNSDDYLPNGASAKAGLNKSILDAAWSSFVNLLKYKSEQAGKLLICVNPAFTSQICSCCGEIVWKTLSIRTHRCTNCGLVLNRDHNAAINILRLGLQSQG